MREHYTWDGKTDFAGQTFEGDFCIYDSKNKKITSLKGCPKIINGDFDIMLDYSQIDNFEGLPEIINGNVTISALPKLDLKYIKKITGKLELFSMDGSEIEQKYNEYFDNLEYNDDIYGEDIDCQDYYEFFEDGVDVDYITMPKEANVVRLEGIIFHDFDLPKNFSKLEIEHCIIDIKKNKKSPKELLKFALAINLNKLVINLCKGEKFVIDDYINVSKYIEDENKIKLLEILNKDKINTTDKINLYKIFEKLDNEIKHLNSRYRIKKTYSNIRKEIMKEFDFINKINKIFFMNV